MQLSKQCDQHLLRQLQQLASGLRHGRARQRRCVQLLHGLRHVGSRYSAVWDDKWEPARALHHIMHGMCHVTRLFNEIRQVNAANAAAIPCSFPLMANAQAHRSTPLALNPEPWAQKGAALPRFLPPRPCGEQQQSPTWVTTPCGTATPRTTAWDRASGEQPRLLHGNARACGAGHLHGTWSCSHRCSRSSQRRPAVGCSRLAPAWEQNPAAEHAAAWRRRCVL